MALEQRRDGKMWKDIFNFNSIVVLSGFLYLMLFVACEPVCYTKISLDERNRHIKRVDCDGAEEICWRFASRKDLKMGDLFRKKAAAFGGGQRSSACTVTRENLVSTITRYRWHDSRCTYSEDYPATAITCSTTNLPTVTYGFFDCAPKSYVPKGKSCNLTCKNGFYPPYSNQTVCEAGTSDQGKEWSMENFECRAITCQKSDLPTVNAGLFNCSGNSVGNKCNLTCDERYYPSSSKETVCERNIDNKANWTAGSFQCNDCDEWNKWNGSEYKYIISLRTRDRYRELCESSSSHLVTIENKEENEFVRKMVLYCDTFRFAWIGFNDIDAEGTWEWSDGTVSTYKNWGEGEPNGGDEGDTMDCVFMYGGNGEWYNDRCTRRGYAVCEKNKTLS